jgi:CRP/FNR family transcriptional regulator, cyclic AMP receptor protein
MSKLAQTSPAPIQQQQPSAPNRAIGLQAPPAPDPSDFRGYFKVETYPHNSVIYRPGDPADKVFLLKGGRVRLIRVGKGTSRAVIGILRTGDLFGEMLRPDGALSDELAVAAGEAEVWSIDGRVFQQLLQSRPQLAVDVVRTMNERIRVMRRRLLGLTFNEMKRDGHLGNVGRVLCVKNTKALRKLGSKEK